MIPISQIVWVTGDSLLMADKNGRGRQKRQNVIPPAPFGLLMD
jgi:hypothetical protein